MKVKIKHIQTQQLDSFFNIETFWILFCYLDLESHFMKSVELYLYEGTI